MTIKLNDLKEFVKTIKQDKIGRDNLERKIAEHWGMSDYIVEQRLKYLLRFGMVKPSKESNDILVIDGKFR